jgi:hypothetical protein
MSELDYMYAGVAYVGERIGLGTLLAIAGILTVCVNVAVWLH